MDWFTWLSKTNLDPSLVYEYALTFTHNELSLDDVSFFSHEFLQSMGVSIAKHRLEILKLARKKKGISVIPVLWFLFAIKQTKNYIVKNIRSLVQHHSSPLSVVPTRSGSLRWKVAMLQRNTRLRVVPPVKKEWRMVGKDGDRFVSDHRILMLTNGSPSRSSCSSGSSVWVESEAGRVANAWNGSFERGSVCSPDKEYSLSSTDEIKWDLMFKNMKPT